MIKLLSMLSALSVALVMFAQTVVVASGFEALTGDYVVISVRRNSLVASTAPPISSGEKSPIGKTVEFNAKGIFIDGISCDAWTADSITTPVDFADDPMLSDLRLPPTDSPITDGDKRLAKSYRISCEGEAFTTLYQADSRVLALSWANSSLYLVLERRLSSVQIKKLQLALKSLKFYSGTASGQFDEATEKAVRAWYTYRQTDKNASTPRRPAITENLLDTMKVLN